MKFLLNFKKMTYFLNKHSAALLIELIKEQFQSLEAYSKKISFDIDALNLLLSGKRAASPSIWYSIITPMKLPISWDKKRKTCGIRGCRKDAVELSKLLVTCPIAIKDRVEQEYYVNPKLAALMAKECTTVAECNKLCIKKIGSKIPVITNLYDM